MAADSTARRFYLHTKFGQSRIKQQSDCFTQHRLLLFVHTNLSSSVYLLNRVFNRNVSKSGLYEAVERSKLCGWYSLAVLLTSRQIQITEIQVLIQMQYTMWA